MTYDFTEYITLKTTDSLTDQILKLILANLSGAEVTGGSSTPGKQTLTGTGSIAGDTYKSITFVINSDDATVLGDACTRGDSFTFASDSGNKVGAIGYDCGSGSITIITIA